MYVALHLCSDSMLCMMRIIKGQHASHCRNACSTTFPQHSSLQQPESYRQVYVTTVFEHEHICASGSLHRRNHVSTQYAFQCYNTDLKFPLVLSGQPLQGDACGCAMTMPLRLFVFLHLETRAAVHPFTTVYTRFCTPFSKVNLLLKHIAACKRLSFSFFYQPLNFVYQPLILFTPRLTLLSNHLTLCTNREALLTNRLTLFLTSYVVARVCSHLYDVFSPMRRSRYHSPQTCVCQAEYAFNPR
jgi:hypothetical protein